MSKIDLIILIAMILTALWTVMARSLLRAAIGLALTSVIVSMMMYRLNAPLAAVFELSVCAGLISVIFITTISLTQPLTWSEIADHAKRRMRRFWLLPLLVIFTAILVLVSGVNFSLPLPSPEVEGNVRNVLWNLRPFDLLGQIIILLAGAYGVVILFREIKSK
jgi:NADH-quinone oxidoreductase subunit J